MLGRFQNAAVILHDISGGGYTYYVAECGNEPAGYCAVKPDHTENSLFLSKLYTAKKFRGNGLAKRFMEILEERCKIESFKYIRLTVNKRNTGSIEAYRKMGFNILQSIISDIGGGFFMDDYVLIKNIQN